MSDINMQTIKKLLQWMKEYGVEDPDDLIDALQKHYDMDKTEAKRLVNEFMNIGGSDRGTYGTSAVY